MSIRAVKSIPILTANDFYKFCEDGSDVDFTVLKCLAHDSDMNTTITCSL